MPSMAAVSFSNTLFWHPSSSSILAQLNAFVPSALSTSTSPRLNLFQTGWHTLKHSIFQKAITWYSLFPSIAFPPFVTSLCSAFASDSRNYAIVALSFFTVILCYRLGSLAKSIAPSQKQPFVQAASSTSRNCQEWEQRRIVIGGEDVDQIMQECQRLAPGLSYLAMTQVLRQFLLPMGSIWPREYYEAYQQARRHGKMMSLKKSVVLKHIKAGLVVIDHPYLSPEDIINREWRGLLWEDDYYTK
ncbi:hypothetical protein I309_00433 [Cryptococcus deuterogattii LA55]|nr:hypothetical protein I309_00433 [Cryptococcus deuterogattii LA55]KIR92227.1 hypothetical protein I304_03631 [Cryptococcus deuterogattii CBS 10090]